MPFGIGPMEGLIVLIIALIILGPKRLPDAGRALGSGLRNFKGGLLGEPSHTSEDPASDAIEASARLDVRSR
jgi:sec-independent protein translocase protein TatA